MVLEGGEIFNTVSLNGWQEGQGCSFVYPAANTHDMPVMLLL
jgi:hypothetical protein